MKSPRNKTIAIDPGDAGRYRPAQIPPAVEAGLFAGDALDLLARVKEVDLVVTDPPYNLGKDFGNNRDSRPDWPEWTARWLDLAKQALRPTGSIYVCSTWERSGVLQRLLEERFIVRNRITWKRDKGRGAKANWKMNHEDVWYATMSGRATFNLEAVKVEKKVVAPYRDEAGRPKDWVETAAGPVRRTHPSNIWTDLVVPFWSMAENTVHPTQKPERLVERILLASSNPGDFVVDPFVGSGTTAVVARRLGRRFAGCDLNADYVRLAMKRLEHSGSLFV